MAQYVEMFPTAGGPATGGAKLNPVPRAVSRAIDRKGQADAPRLHALLASPVYGGPSLAAPPPRATAASRILKVTRPLHAGELASVLTSVPGNTFEFWLLVLTATALPLFVRRSMRREWSGRQTSD